MAAKSIITNDMGHCIVCGAPYPEAHHIIYGWANRKLSDRYGLIAPLCARHHRGPEGVHFDKKFDTELKKYAQLRFREEYEEDFKAVFGKSYL